MQAALCRSPAAHLTDIISSAYFLLFSQLLVSDYILRRIVVDAVMSAPIEVMAQTLYLTGLDMATWA